MSSLNIPIPLKLKEIKPEQTFEWIKQRIMDLIKYSRVIDEAMKEIKAPVLGTYMGLTTNGDPMTSVLLKPRGQTVEVVVRMIDKDDKLEYLNTNELLMDGYDISMLALLSIVAKKLKKTYGEDIKIMLALNSASETNKYPLLIVNDKYIIEVSINPFF